jgi:putative endonuclease
VLLVFCEVKTRTSNRYGAPEESVVPRQVARVRAAARSFLASSSVPSPRPRVIRFDVACVSGRNAEVSVIEDAF